MEADIAVEIFLRNKNFDTAKVKLGTLIGDDDSSTIARLRRESNHVLCRDFDFQSVPSRSENELFTRYWNRRRVS